MRFPERIAAMTVLLIVIAYGTVAPTAQAPATSAPVVLTPAQMEEFLLKSQVADLQRKVAFLMNTLTSPRSGPTPVP